MPNREIDVGVTNHGTIMTFQPMTQLARDWIEEHVGKDAQWHSGALAVESKYAGVMAEGMIGDGLEVV